MSPVEVALAYADMGLYVLAVNHTYKGVCMCPFSTKCLYPGKHPIKPILPKGVNNATNDKDIIAEWWSRYPRANIGIAMGKSGIVAFDFDKAGMDYYASISRDHPEIKDTVEEISGNGGRHLWYRLPSNIVIPASNSRITLGLDIKSNNSYIVTYPSKHKSGNIYRFIIGKSPFEREIAEMPAFLIELIRKHIPDEPDEDSKATLQTKEVFEGQLPQFKSQGSKRYGHKQSYQPDQWVRHFVQKARTGSRGDLCRNLAFQLYDTGLSMDDALPYIADYVTDVNEKTKSDLQYAVFTYEEGKRQLERAYTYLRTKQERHHDTGR